MRLELLSSFVFVVGILLASSAQSDSYPNLELIGRTLGFDLSYDRECRETGTMHEGDRLVFLTSYANALSKFALSLDERHHKEFLSEFISASVRSHADCVAAESELDRYWSVLEEAGTSKECMIRHLLDSSVPMLCEHKN